MGVIKAEAAVKKKYHSPEIDSKAAADAVNRANSWSSRPGEVRLTRSHLLDPAVVAGALASESVSSVSVIRPRASFSSSNRSSTSDGSESESTRKSELLESAATASASESGRADHFDSIRADTPNGMSESVETESTHSVPDFVMDRIVCSSVNVVMHLDIEWIGSIPRAVTMTSLPTEAVQEFDDL